MLGEGFSLLTIEIIEPYDRREDFGCVLYINIKPLINDQRIQSV